MFDKTAFAPSKKPYAFDWDSFSVDPRGKATVTAVWAGRKKGVTTISYGHVWDFGVQTLEEFLDRFDTARYGGNCEARWDGHILWAPGFTPTEQVKTSQMLEEMLAGFPNVPAGFDGWYLLKDAPRR